MLKSRQIMLYIINEVIIIKPPLSGVLRGVYVPNQRLSEAPRTGTRQPVAYPQRQHKDRSHTTGTFGRAWGCG